MLFVQMIAYASRSSHSSPKSASITPLFEQHDCLIQTYLQECSACIVDGLDQTLICNTHGVGAKADDVTMLLMELPLCFNVGLSIVIEKAPYVGELG